MTLKTSSRKINPFWNMIGFTLRKNFGIIIVLCIVGLLFCPGVYFVNFVELFEGRYTPSQPYGETPQDFTEVFGIVISIFVPIFVTVFNYVNFSFLYKKNASDVFHAFPLTRAELLLSRMISSVLSALTPALLCTLFYVGMVIFNPWLGHFGTLLYYLALMLVITILWASFTMIFIVCAGSAFDLTLSFFGVNIAIILVALIANNVFDETLLGYSGDVEQILHRISLPFFCANHENVEFWIKSIIYIAVFITVALLLYNRRKAEKGGTAYAYKFMYYACSVLISICGGYLVGMLFDNDIYSLIFWFFMLIGSMIFALIYGLITNRGFKGALRSVIMGGIAWVVLIAVMISSVTGGFGFSKRVPKARLVKEVTVSALNLDGTFTDPDLAIKLHKKTIENAISYDDWVARQNENLIVYGDKTTYIEDVYRLNFDYVLNSGATVERLFYVPFETINDELLAVMQNEERYENIIKESCVNLPQIKTVKFSFNIDGGYNDVEGYISADEYKKFLDSYWQDVKSIKNFADMRGESISFNVSVNGETEYFWLEFSDKFYNTMEFVDAYRYPYLK